MNDKIIVDVIVGNCKISALKPEIQTFMPNEAARKITFFGKGDSPRLNQREFGKLKDHALQEAIRLVDKYGSIGTSGEYGSIVIEERDFVPTEKIELLKRQIADFKREDINRGIIAELTLQLRKIEEELVECVTQGDKPIPILKVYESTTGWFWFITKIDKQDPTNMYGCVVGLGNELEWDYIDTTELESISSVCEVPRRNWSSISYVKLVPADDVALTAPDP